MKNKIYSIITSISFLAVLVIFAFSGILLHDKEISYSERRKLAELPNLSIDSLFDKESGEKNYFDELEKYLLDQFPWRDDFRAINVSVKRYGFMQKDIGGIYVKNNRIFKMDYILNEKAVEHSTDVYCKVIEKYFSNNADNIYYTIVPDKNYYSAEKNGRLSIDYEKMFSIMHKKMGAYSFIDIRDMLNEEDYYRTDLHWEQQDIIDVANKLLNGMGEAGNLQRDDFKEKVFEGFKGAYYGQAALPLEADKIVYLSNDTLEHCKVFDYEQQKYISLYAEEKLGGIDSYV